MNDTARYEAERAKFKPLPFDAARAIFIKNGMELVRVGRLRVVVDG